MDISIPRCVVFLAAVGLPLQAYAGSNHTHHTRTKATASIPDPNDLAGQIIGPKTSQQMALCASQLTRQSSGVHVGDVVCRRGEDDPKGLDALVERHGHNGISTGYLELQYRPAKGTMTVTTASPEPSSGIWREYPSSYKTQIDAQNCVTLPGAFPSLLPLARTVVHMDQVLNKQQ